VCSDQLFSIIELHENLGCIVEFSSNSRALMDILTTLCPRCSFRSYGLKKRQRWGPICPTLTSWYWSPTWCIATPIPFPLNGSIKVDGRQGIGSRQGSCPSILKPASPLRYLNIAWDRVCDWQQRNWYQRTLKLRGRHS